MLAVYAELDEGRTMTPAQADFLKKWDPTCPGITHDLLKVLVAERERCAYIADGEAAHSYPQNPEFDAGYRQCAEDIARRIRELI